MSLQFNVDLRNAWLDAIETAGGASPTLQVRTGSKPATCASAATGTVLVSFSLPADWLVAGSGGVISKNGLWTGTTSITGQPGYFRIINATSNVCIIQGTATVDGGGGDMEIDIVPIVAGFQFTVVTFQISAPGG